MAAAGDAHTQNSAELLSQLAAPALRFGYADKLVEIVPHLLAERARPDNAKIDFGVQEARDVLAGSGALIKGVPTDELVDAGVVKLDGANAIAGFIAATKKTRIWDREPKVRNVP